MSHILILDIGKTNKKAFIFDDNYRIVFEKSKQLPETTDEDGYPCEDIHLLVNWLRESLREVLQLPDFQIKAVNFSAYGASFVYLDELGEILTPLYNYLKPYPEVLTKQLFEKYGSELKLSSETASPILGSLNSGLQLYRIKTEQQDVYNRIKYALHLPQFLCYAITGNTFCELTSIGCHTMLWDFNNTDYYAPDDIWDVNKNSYHLWVKKEGLVEKFPVLSPSSMSYKSSFAGQHIFVGIGIHDSSSALIPYLASKQEPFILLSTGSWNIALNPFNDTPLLPEELTQDCLCYLSYEGNPVKASRLFAGNEHGEAVKKLGLEGQSISGFNEAQNLGEAGRKYLDFMRQLIDKQAVAIKLVLTQNVSQIFVDGGFSKNEIFMTLLAEAFPRHEVYAATVAQASALGAAVAVHDVWNNKPLPKDLIKVKRYFAK